MSVEINGIYFDVGLQQRYVILSISEESTQDWVKVVWLSNHNHLGMLLSSVSTFPVSAMYTDVYCGQASELMLALLQENLWTLKQLLNITKTTWEEWT